MPIRIPFRVFMLFVLIKVFKYKKKTLKIVDLKTCGLVDLKTCGLEDFLLFFLELIFQNILFLYSLIQDETIIF